MVVTAVAFAAVLVVLAVQAVQLRRLGDRLAAVENCAATEMAELNDAVYLARKGAHERINRLEVRVSDVVASAHRHGARFDHEPAIQRVLSGEHGRPGGDL